MRKRVYSVTLLLQYNGTHVVEAGSADEAERKIRAAFTADPAEYLHSSDLAGTEVLSVHPGKPTKREQLGEGAGFLVETITCPDCWGDGDCVAGESGLGVDCPVKRCNGSTCHTCGGATTLRVIR